MEAAANIRRFVAKASEPAVQPQPRPAAGHGLRRSQGTPGMVGTRALGTAVAEPWGQRQGTPVAALPQAAGWGTEPSSCQKSCWHALCSLGVSRGLRGPSVTQGRQAGGQGQCGRESSWDGDLPGSRKPPACSAPANPDPPQLGTHSSSSPHPSQGGTHRASMAHHGTVWPGTTWLPCPGPHGAPAHPWPSPGCPGRPFPLSGDRTL